MKHSATNGMYVKSQLLKAQPNISETRSTLSFFLKTLSIISILLQKKGTYYSVIMVFSESKKPNGSYILKGVSFQ